jgi:proteasome alpha subunit
MYGASPQAYDKAMTVFSPDGRLFQVEYAKEAVKRGATSLGIIAKDGIAMAAVKSIYSPLIVPDSIRKIFEVDKHIYITASGLIADARKLVELARDQAIRHRVVYSEPISTVNLVKYLADIMQSYTQYGGVRPFGISLLVGGFDGNNTNLYEIEPSGAMVGYHANAIGSRKAEAEEYLKKHYQKDIKLDDAVKLAIKCLAENEEEKNFEIEAFALESKEGIFREVPEKIVKKYL